MKFLTVIVSLSALLGSALAYTSNAGSIEAYATIVPAGQNAESHWPKFLKKHPTIIVRLVSDTCPKCKESQPAFDAIASKHPEIKVIDINFRKYGFAKNITRKRRILSLPAFLFYKDGDLVYVHKARVDEPILERAIKKHL